MYKKSLLIFLFACTIISCGNNSTTKENPVEKKTAAPPVYKMDMLEKIFNNDNWMKTAGKDTSYYYFSRVPSEIKVCEYKMIKGDSVISSLSVMRFSHDTIVWEFDDTTHLFLNAVTEKSSEWAKIEDSPKSYFIAFEQKDEKQINVTGENGKSFMLTRTLPLSTFLIRSRYDYLNGTNYAFSDTVFSKAPKK